MRANIMCKNKHEKQTINLFRKINQEKRQNLIVKYYSFNRQFILSAIHSYEYIKKHVSGVEYNNR